MVEDRKKTILYAGSQLFAEKGYFATTVQDIAEQCNMSKASIYKLFQSKEDILLQIVSTLHEEIVQASSTLHFEDNVPPREQLVQKLVVQLREFIVRHNFFINLNQNVPMELGSQIRNVMLNFKRTMISWQKEALVQAFGTEIEPIVWDLAVAMQGMLREFVFLSHVDRKTKLDLEALAAFIVESMEAVIHQRMGKEPVVNTELATHLNLYDPEVGRKYFGESEWRKSVRELTLAVHQRSPEHIRADLLAAVERLDVERRKKVPQAFMMDALIAYLRQREELSEEVSYLQHVYFANWEEEKHG
ncbi:TetR/AcrR family transcriptional regulator [Paenibacillus dauci]|uniref:TetR/AcrR family transcriptional regulator n=1 Tax=Paenibacillus dauci TaxID=1567106 RepID=UPI00061932E6|nr:TetR/AcrR family transcriptional regulator [Paenibacillus dauci]